MQSMIWLGLFDGLGCKVNVYVFPHGSAVWCWKNVVEDV